MNDRYILWLSRISGISGKIKLRLFEYFNDAEAIFRAKRYELEATGFLNTKNVYKILSEQDSNLLDGYIKGLEKTDMGFVPITSDKYPALLKEIHVPPLGIYYLGTLPSQESCYISIIGSRKCTEYGLSISHRFSSELAGAGIVIVSGMARGVDSMAHRGALDADGVTVAVLGCGADVCYPPENKALMRRIQERGCVISEYPPGTKPTLGYFPERNRIISGISRATIVVEAGCRSGTLITVDQALNEGREVMAVPGNITSKMSEGTNHLIRQGASLVTSSEEILEHLGIEFDTLKKDDYSVLAPVEKLVYDCIEFEPTAIDFIYDKLNAAPGEVNYVLTLLEMRKLIRRIPGQRVVRL